MVLCYMNMKGGDEGFCSNHQITTFWLKLSTQQLSVQNFIVNKVLSFIVFIIQRAAHVSPSANEFPVNISPFVFSFMFEI